MTNHLFALFRTHLSEAGRPFVETPEGGGAAIDYRGMLELSGRLANLLAARGVGPGDRVAVQVEKSPQAVALYLACLRAGAVYLPLNDAYTAAELDYFLGDAAPALVVGSPARRAELAALAGRRAIPAVETLGVGDGSLPAAAAAMPADFQDVARGADDLAALLYTSGTTGRSKGAMLTHGNLASNALTLAEAWRFTEDDVLLHALPIFHTHGLFVAINVCLVAGASMLFLPRFEADRVLRLMGRATVMMGVPTFYVRLLQHPGLDRAATASMRLFVSGSAPLLAETHARWAERTGHAILERYGMTETNMNTSNPYDGERVAGTVGFPLPGVEIRVTDSGRPLPAGAVGMIEVRGPNVFKGYWHMPEKTAVEFRPDGFFVTGDLGLIDGRGYLHIVGRSKDLVISGGYNVYPREVEAELDALPGVAESAVIGLAHPDLGEAVTAIVVMRPGALGDEEAIRRGVAERLAGYKRPKRVLFAEELPRNAMGKVQKAVLRERYKTLYG